MKRHLLVLLLVLLAGYAQGYEDAYEQSTVSRIVGESPAELQAQLQRDEMTLQHATWLTNDGDHTLTNSFRQMLFEHVFADRFYTNRPGSYAIADILPAVHNFEPQELFVLDGEDGGTADALLSIDPDEGALTPSALRAWAPDLQRTHPLVILDAPYAGKYVPKQDNLAARLVGDATLIAPTAFNSHMFESSFLCALIDQQTVGGAFRNARNLHYSDGAKSTFLSFEHEPVTGLLLQSYQLYGNPLQTINMEFWTADDREDIKATWCKNLLDNMEAGVEYVGLVGNLSRFRKTLVFTIENYTFDNSTNYTLVSIPGLSQTDGLTDLVLPYSVRTTYLPEGTILLNATLNSAEDAVTFMAEDLPSFDETYVNRTCFEDRYNFSVGFGDEHGAHSHNLVATILPITVENCTTGRLTLYRRFNYSVDYLTASPAVIEDVRAPARAVSGEPVEVNVTLRPVQNGTVSMALGVFEGTTPLAEQELISNETNASLVFFAPMEGAHQYTVEVLYRNLTTHAKAFSVDVVRLDVLPTVPVTARPSQTLNLSLLPYTNETYNVTFDYYLLYNGSPIQQGSILTVMAGAAKNLSLNFTGLTRKNQTYELQAYYHYGGIKKVLSLALTSNNMPLLAASSAADYLEDENVTVNYTVFDADGDALNVTINDARFRAVEQSFVWDTGFADAGSYAFQVSATDGLLTKNATVEFSVLDYYLPASFSGLIREPNGTLVQNGTLAATANGTPISSADLNASNYSIAVPYDDPETPWTDGARPGDIIEFALAGFQVMPGFPWNPNTSTTANLTATPAPDLDGFSVIEASGRYALFELALSNRGLQSVSGINWSLDTGESRLVGRLPFTLAPQQSAILYVEHRYAAPGAFAPSAAVFNGAFNLSASTALTVESDIAITSLTLLNTNATDALFEVAIRNTLGTASSDIAWAFHPGASSRISSGLPMRLTAQQRGAILIAYRYPAPGAYTASVNVTHNGSTAQKAIAITI